MRNRLNSAAFRLGAAALTFSLLFTVGWLSVRAQTSAPSNTAGASSVRPGNGQEAPVPPGAPGGEPGRPRRPPPKPVNLQVLPKTMTGEQVIQVMHGFEGQLGVECGFCHAPDPATHRLNFASDAKPEKSTARLMMHMTADINQKYLTQINDPDHADHPAPPVGCGTCHRGKSMPDGFTPPPVEDHHDHGPA